MLSVSFDFSAPPTVHALCFFPDRCFLYCSLRSGGAGTEPTESGRMVGTKRCGNCVMIDFYRKGSLKKNGVIVNPNRHKYSTSYPVFVEQEAEMQMLEGTKS